MFAGRLTVEAELVLLSPLHLGTGEIEAYRSIEHEDPLKDEPQAASVATVMRDVHGMPVIPGASVKGVLRSLAAGADGAAVLFGPPAGDTGVDEPEAPRQLFRGRLTAYALRYKSDNEPLRLAAGLPFAGRHMPDRVRLEKRGLFIAARTAIDPGTGTAEERKLFYQEMVAPGARFVLQLALGLDASGDGGEAEACLLRVLKALSAEDGVAFGKGQSLGQGRMRLDCSTPRAWRRKVDDATRALRTSEDTGFRAAVTAAAAIGVAQRHELELRCDGPFLVDDASVEPERGSEESRLNAQVMAGRPLLAGSTLTGALRARAGWLAKLLWDGERGADGRERILALRDMAAAASGDERIVIDPAELTPVERLFGVTGWRGLVQVAKIECTGFAGFEEITSVKLDRFSMAPIDGALFTTWAAIDPVFRVVLEVERRGDYPRDNDDAVLVAALLEDLLLEGVMLGHGTNRGYGWFGVKRTGATP